LGTFAFANNGKGSLRRIDGFEAVSNQPSKTFSDKPAHVVEQELQFTGTPRDFLFGDTYVAIP